MVNVKCTGCANLFDVDETSLDAMRIVTCPACSSSFQLPLPKGPQPGQDAKGTGGQERSDFDDFFEVDQAETTSPRPIVKPKKQEPAPKEPSDAAADDFLSAPADFLKDALDQNINIPGAGHQQAAQAKEVKATSDEVFGGLEGFEEFLSTEEPQAKLDKKPEPAAKPAPPKADIPKKPAQPPPPPPPKNVQAAAPKKDALDDAFEELFAEPPKEEKPKKAAPFVEAKAKPAPERIEKRPPPPPPPAPRATPPPKKVDAKKSGAPDTVSDEAFEALFHDIKGATGKAAPEEESVEPGLDIPLKKKRGLNVKLALLIGAPILVAIGLIYVLVFTKSGIFGFGFYSYFIEGYRKPASSVMKVLDKNFIDAKANLKKDSQDEYLAAIKLLKDILSKDTRYAGAHAYLSIAMLFASGDPLNQSTKKEIESLLEQSDKLNPSLAEGILARGLYNFRSGDFVGAEKTAKRALDSGIKDPLIYEILGAISFSRSNFSQARTYYMDAVRLDPENLRISHSLAMADYSDGRTEDALKTLDRLRKAPLDHVPSEIDYQYIQMKDFGRKDEARQVFLDLLEKSQDRLGDYDFARLAMYLADILSGEGKTEKAAEVLEKGMKKDPYNHAIAYRLGIIYLGQGKMDKAIEFLKKATSLAPKEVEYYIPYARALRMNKQSEQSLAEISKALEGNSTNSAALLEKGLSEKELAKYQDALNTFQEVIKSDPKNLDALIESGDINIRQENYREARDLFAQVVKMAPKNARAHSGLGMAYTGLGNREASLKEFEIAEKLSPNNVQIILNIAKSLLAMSKLDEAKKNFEKVLAIDKKVIDAQVGLGDILFTKQRYDEAVKIYKEAQANAPKDVDLMVKLAKAQIELKQYKPALDILLEASKLIVDYFPVYLELGIVYRDLNSMDDSLTELARSVELRPDSADAHYEYGVTLILNSQVSTGLPHLIKAIEIDPKHIRSLEKLVEHYYETNNTDKAIDYALKALEVAPSRSGIRLKLADCYRRVNNDKDAYKTYVDVIRQDRYETKAYIGAAEILEDTKQYGKALEFYQMAGKINPKDPIIYYHLGFVYKYLGQKEKAVRAFSTYLKLNPDASDADEIKDEIFYLRR